MENLNSDNLMRQFTTVADAEEFSRLTSAKSTRCLSNNTHSNTDQSLDLQEIEELQAEVVDQERGKLRTKSKARKKLEHEKAVQRQ